MQKTKLRQSGLSAVPSSEKITIHVQSDLIHSECRIVRIGRAPIERASCPGRVCALEKTLRGYAQKKIDTAVVSTVGSSFDSSGEAYDYYNLYSWEVGFGIRYGKSRLNVERTKCMQEIVCGYSVSAN
uniref:Uncharacterized protein n=1 Tax=Aegilops tauschii subsp. strangulata TaxID=200361 RepID=A0A453DNQ6_AEGTS